MNRHHTSSILSRSCHQFRPIRCVYSVWLLLENGLCGFVQLPVSDVWNDHFLFSCWDVTELYRGLEVLFIELDLMSSVCVSGVRYVSLTGHRPSCRSVWVANHPKDVGSQSETILKICLDSWSYSSWKQACPMKQRNTLVLRSWAHARTPRWWTLFPRYSKAVQRSGEGSGGGGTDLLGKLNRQAGRWVSRQTSKQTGRPTDREASRRQPDWQTLTVEPHDTP